MTYPKNKKQYCSKCKTEEGPFIKNATGPSGIIYYQCRTCNTSRAKKYRATSEGKKKIYDAVKKSMKKHKQHTLARGQVKEALKYGRLIRPDKCEECEQKLPLQGHHEDYSKSLEVNWLCRSCHSNRHREIKDNMVK